VHPQTVALGWREATQLARKALEAMADDNANDPVAFRQDLVRRKEGREGGREGGMRESIPTHTVTEALNFQFSPPLPPSPPPFLEFEFVTITLSIGP